MTAYADYSELRAGVESWVARSDFPVSIYALATARINRKLRVRQMLSAYSATVSAEGENLPADFLEFHHVYVDRDPRVILSAQDAFEQTIGYRASGIPTTYYISGAQIRFNPVPDGSYDLAGEYYASLADFSVDADTNDVLTAFPEIYLASTLAYVFAWDQDAENEARWLSHFNGLVEEAHRDAMEARFAQPIKMRPRASA